LVVLGSPRNAYSIRVSRIPRWLAGELGFEPRQTESESVVLPLHHSPMFSVTYREVLRFLRGAGKSGASVCPSTRLVRALASIGRWASRPGPGGPAAIWPFCAPHRIGSMSVGVGLRRLARRKNAGIVAGAGLAYNHSGARKSRPNLWCQSMDCPAMKRSRYWSAQLADANRACNAERPKS
jgi:hypothetical protein